MNLNKVCLASIMVLGSQLCHAGWEPYWESDEEDVQWSLDEASTRGAGKVTVTVLTSFSYKDPTKVPGSQLTIRSGTVSFEIDCASLKYRAQQFVAYEGKKLGGPPAIDSNDLYDNGAIDVWWRSVSADSHLEALMKRVCSI